MRSLTSRLVFSKQILVFVVALLFIGAGLLYAGRAYGDLLPNRSLLISSSTAGATGASYTISMDIPASETLGSIELQFCANNPIFDEPCTVPAGLDISSATLTNQTGITDFAVSNATTSDMLILTRTPSTVAPQHISYELSGVTNPSNPGPYYGRLQTFASSDASGTENAHGGLAFDMNGGVSVKVTVPPYLLFCSAVSIPAFDCGTATGNYVNFGNLSPDHTSSAQTQMLLATNAENGYNIAYTGTTMTSGIHTIPPLSNLDVARPGVNQFGINLVANQDPSIGANPTGPGSGTVTSNYNQPNRYLFEPNDIIASSTTVSAYRKYTVSYIINITKDQYPGIYDSTFTYVALASF